MFKEQILAKLVEKYPGLSKEFLGLFAEKLSAKVTEETQIEGVINELDNSPVSVTDLAAAFQKEGDSRVDKAKKQWIKNPPKPDKPVKTDPTPAEQEPQEDETKTLLKTLLEKVSRIEGEKIQSAISQKIQAHEKLKAIPEKYYAKRKLPEKEDDIEAFVDEVATDYADFEQELVNKGLSTTVKPVVTNDTKGKEKVSAEMQAYLAEKNKTVETKN